MIRNKSSDIVYAIRCGKNGNTQEMYWFLVLVVTLVVEIFALGL